MQKRLLLREGLELLTLSAAACALLFFPETASAAVVRGLRQCGAAILPSLFPFFICANLITELSLTRIPARLLGRLMRPVFHLGGTSSAALVLGLVGGYPAGAQAVAQLYESGSISQEEAGRLLLFCNNAGPAFVTGVCGVCVLGSAKAGLLLYAVHVFCALLTGVLLRGPLPDAAPPAAHTSPEKAPGFAAAFITSVKRAGTAALQVCMFVVAFSVLSAGGAGAAGRDAGAEQRRAASGRMPGGLPDRRVSARLFRAERLRTGAVAPCASRAWPWTVSARKAPARRTVCTAGAAALRPSSAAGGSGSGRFSGLASAFAAHFARLAPARDNLPEIPQTELWKFSAKACIIVGTESKKRGLAAQFSKGGVRVALPQENRSLLYLLSVCRTGGRSYDDLSEVRHRSCGASLPPVPLRSAQARTGPPGPPRAGKAG